MSASPANNILCDVYCDNTVTIDYENNYLDNPIKPKDVNPSLLTNVVNDECFPLNMKCRVQIENRGVYNSEFDTNNTPNVFYDETMSINNVCSNNKPFVNIELDTNNTQNVPYDEAFPPNNICNISKPCANNVCTNADYLCNNSICNIGSSTCNTYTNENPNVNKSCYYVCKSNVTCVRANENIYFDNLLKKDNNHGCNTNTNENLNVNIPSYKLHKHDNVQQNRSTPIQYTQASNENITLAHRQTIPTTNDVQTINTHTAYSNQSDTNTTQDILLATSNIPDTENNSIATNKTGLKISFLNVCGFESKLCRPEFLDYINVYDIIGILRKQE